MHYIFIYIITNTQMNTLYLTKFGCYFKKILINDSFSFIPCLFKWHKNSVKISHLYAQIHTVRSVSTNKHAVLLMIDKLYKKNQHFCRIVKKPNTKKIYMHHWKQNNYKLLRYMLVLLH